MILSAPPPLLAVTSRTYFDVARLHTMTEWWHWMLLVAVVIAITALLIAVYRRDAVELPKGTGILLIALRLIAFVGLLVFFLDIEKRTERKLVKPSRVALMIDTSQSMGLGDSMTQASTTPQSRLARFVDELTHGDFLSELRKKHDVTIYRFAQNAVPEDVAMFSKTGDASQGTEATTESLAADSFREARRMYIVAAAFFLLAGIALLAHLLLGPRFQGAEGESWALLAAGLLLIVAVVVTAVTNLRHPRLTIASVLTDDPAAVTTEAPKDDTPVKSAEPAVEETNVDWSQQLVARGTETRIGDAIQWIVEKERGGPLAGVVLVTDGRSNAGIEPELAATQAKEAVIPVYPIGAGSEKTPKSVRVLDLEAPPRVFPGDNFTMTAYVQAEGLEGRSVNIVLASSDAKDDKDVEVIESEQRLALGPDGQIVPVKFELTPDHIGQRRWVFRIQAPREDLDAADNEKSANVEVVERKNQVLLLAGGPTREYRFLRNLLYRDKDTTLHVLLQSSPVGGAQEADELLSEFPATPESMFAYDCVVAFDPDWRQLTAEQIDLLDRWVAEKAGGLIVVAGPVYTPQWTRGREAGAKLNTIKGLYPVTFYERSSSGIFLGRFSADTAWPLKFTDEGETASFLALADSPAESRKAWSDFNGVYGFQAVKDVKRGARVYAYFSDPQSAVDEDLPVFMAGQFYGSGRVFFLGSGELWRLRAVDDTYFDRLYTKLIRYVSQGRLLRDSTHGILLVDKERCSLGDSITVRATLSDSQYRPLTLPTVTATILHESGSRETLTLRQVTDTEREGMYSGQFTAVRQGDYRIILPVPDAEEEMLTREVRVRLPAREIERPQRDDALLSEIAKTTDGTYYVSLDAAKGQGGIAPLTNRLAAKDQETYLPGTPDRGFERLLMTWLLGIICGALSLEWLIRRLHKLA